MKQTLLCPRTELCPVYGAYVSQTQDDTLGIIQVSLMQGTPFYSCAALDAVLELAGKGELPDSIVKRLEGRPGCLLIDQANKSVHKHRPDA